MTTSELEALARDALSIALACLESHQPIPPDIEELLLAALPPENTPIH